MRLVDASAWIEGLIDSPTGKRLAGELPTLLTQVHHP